MTILHYSVVLCHIMQIGNKPALTKGLTSRETHLGRRHHTPGYTCTNYCNFHCTGINSVEDIKEVITSKMCPKCDVLYYEGKYNHHTTLVFPVVSLFSTCLPCAHHLLSVCVQALIISLYCASSSPLSLVLLPVNWQSISVRHLKRCLNS